MNKHLPALAVGLVVGFVLVSGILGSIRHPMSRRPWAPDCWELTQTLRLEAGAGGLPALPKSTELAWDGDFAWVTIYLEGGGFERCPTSTPRALHALPGGAADAPR